MSALADRRFALKMRRLQPALVSDLPPLQTPPAVAGHNGGPPVTLTPEEIAEALMGLVGDEKIALTLAVDLVDHGRNFGREIVGSFMAMAGMGFLAVRRPGKGHDEVIGPLHELPVLAITLRQTREDVMAERERRRLGAAVLTYAPENRDQYIAAFSHLTDALVAEADFWRRQQIGAQIDVLADRIELAKAKRRFLIADAYARQDGRRFDPAADCTDLIQRGKYEEPLPQDFDPDPRVRRDRATRYAARMADPLTAELELMRKRMRIAGLDARRPRNAPYLLVRFAMKHGKAATFVYAPGNGLRTPSLERADRESKAARRREASAQRRPDFAVLRRLVDERRREFEEAPATQLPPSPVVAPGAAATAPSRRPEQLRLFCDAQ